MSVPMKPVQQSRVHSRVVPAAVQASASTSVTHFLTSALPDRITHTVMTALASEHAKDNNANRHDLVRQAVWSAISTSTPQILALLQQDQNFAFNSGAGASNVRRIREWCTVMDCFRRLRENPHLFSLSVLAIMDVVSQIAHLVSCGHGPGHPDAILDLVIKRYVTSTTGSSSSSVEEHPDAKFHRVVPYAQPLSSAPVASSRSAELRPGSGAVPAALPLRHGPAAAQADVSKQAHAKLHSSKAGSTAPLRRLSPAKPRPDSRASDPEMSKIASADSAASTATAIKVPTGAGMPQSNLEEHLSLQTARGMQGVEQSGGWGGTGDQGAKSSLSTSRSSSRSSADVVAVQHAKAKWLQQQGASRMPLRQRRHAPPLHVNVDIVPARSFDGEVPHPRALPAVAPGRPSPAAATSHQSSDAAKPQGRSESLQHSEATKAALLSEDEEVPGLISRADKVLKCEASLSTRDTPKQADPVHGVSHNAADRTGSHQQPSKHPKQRRAGATKNPPDAAATADGRRGNVLATYNGMDELLASAQAAAAQACVAANVTKQASSSAQPRSTGAPVSKHHTADAENIKPSQHHVRR